MIDLLFYSFRRISSEVPGKTMRECISRAKTLAEIVKGSIVSENAKETLGTRNKMILIK